MRSRLFARFLMLGAVATLPVAAQSPASATPAVAPGIDVLLSDSLHLIRGKRVGLITNHTGRDAAGRRTIDALYNAPGVRLVALYGPEHGLAGVARGGDRIASATDSATGLPIYSLYGETRTPTAAMLDSVDVLLYDIQDVGARVYTYVWTMALAAGAAKRPFIVLDRPDPIRADRVEGGVMTTRWRSFVGLHEVALRYGLTPGELLRWLVGTGRVKADVTVIPMRGYRRSMWYDETGLPWVAPSPNIPTVQTALLYAGTVFFEAANLSEGRGTDRPLELVGASWLTDAAAIARELNARRLPGVRFEATTRAVRRGEEFGGQTIPMVALRVTDRDSLRPTEAAAHLLRAIYRRHPKQFSWRSTGIEELTGSRELRRVVAQGGVDALLARWAAESEQFKAETEKYWLYPP